MTVPGKGPYSRIYHSLMDDPDFDGVYASDKMFATWVRLLMAADAFWPNSAPMPYRNPSVSRLIASGLVVPIGSGRYTIKGLSAERERRSASARNAAAVRWQSDRSAQAMPRRDETRIEEKSGSHANGVPARRSAVALAEDVKRQEAEQWMPCVECGVQGREHSVNGEHPFRGA